MRILQQRSTGANRQRLSSPHSTPRPRFAERRRRRTAATKTHPTYVIKPTSHPFPLGMCCALSASSSLSSTPPPPSSTTSSSFFIPPQCVQYSEEETDVSAIEVRLHAHNYVLWKVSPTQPLTWGVRLSRTCRNRTGAGRQERQLERACGHREQEGAGQAGQQVGLRLLPRLWRLLALLHGEGGS